MLAVLMVFGLSGCGDDPAKEYKDMNEYVSKYFLAYVSEDYYQMKKLLPDKLIQGDSDLENAKKGDKPEEKTKREKMRDKYSITGFDKFYEEDGCMLYLVEYYNYHTGSKKEPLVFAVGKQDDRPTLLSNPYGNYVTFSQFSDKYTGRMFPKHLKQLMSENPDNMFVVKEYPGEGE